MNNWMHFKELAPNLKMMRAIHSTMEGGYIEVRDGWLALTEQGEEVLQPLLAHWGWVLPRVERREDLPADQGMVMCSLFLGTPGDMKRGIRQERFLTCFYWALVEGAASWGPELLAGRMTTRETVQLAIESAMDNCMSARGFHVLLGVFILEWARILGRCEAATIDVPLIHCNISTPPPPSVTRREEWKIILPRYTK